jgi:hypothetical protein
MHPSNLAYVRKTSLSSLNTTHRETNAVHESVGISVNPQQGKFIIYSENLNLTGPNDLSTIKSSSKVGLLIIILRLAEQPELTQSRLVPTGESTTDDVMTEDDLECQCSPFPKIWVGVRKGRSRVSGMQVSSHPPIAPSVGACSALCLVYMPNLDK